MANCPEKIHPVPNQEEYSEWFQKVTQLLREHNSHETFIPAMTNSIVQALARARLSGLTAGLTHVNSTEDIPANPTGAKELE